MFEGVLHLQKKKIPVAVKMCRGRHIGREETLKFMKEARFLRRFKHPNIVQLHGIAAHEEPVMIVMELVSGGSLQRHLQRLGKEIALKDRIRFCLETARGMAYLEKNACIHRDLATRNCLLGKINQVKISDFGLCRDSTYYKMTGSRKVPVKWLAPETLKHGKNCSPNTVVWSISLANTF